FNDRAGALAAHEEARSLAEPPATGPGAPLAARRALGSALEGVGAVLSATRKTDEALAALRRGLRGRQGPARDPAAALDARRALANSHNDIGIVLGSVRE